MDVTLSRIETEIPRLRSYARFLSGDRTRADDLVQECLVRAIEKLDTWQPGTNLGAWLFTILRNSHLDEIRQQSRHPAEEAKDSLPDLAVPAEHEARVYCREVWKATELLLPEYRQALSLVVVEGLTYEQTAKTLDVAVGTVRSRLARARSFLRVWLDDPRSTVRRQLLAEPDGRGAHVHGYRIAAR